MTYLNIAAYKFIQLGDLPALAEQLKQQAKANNLLGTILLSPEGINLMLCGLSEEIHNFRNFLHLNQQFADLKYKQAYSSKLSFKKLFVKIKKEIIAFGVEGVDPINQKAPHIKPQELKQWLDEKREIVLLDARNDYEIIEGTFENAIDLAIKNFRDFPAAAKKLNESLKMKTIVTFCTGGIRCEKAALLLEQYGFNNVCQLEGGILNYFAECGNSHYQGDCYVFDERVKVSAAVNK